jgi:hypothetical protein
MPADCRVDGIARQHVAPAGPIKQGETARVRLALKQRAAQLRWLVTYACCSCTDLVRFVLGRSVMRADRDRVADAGASLLDNVRQLVRQELLSRSTPGRVLPVPEHDMLSNCVGKRSYC